MVEFFLLLCAAALLPFVIAHAARKRGRSYIGFFLLALFFSPLVGELRPASAIASVSRHVDKSHLCRLA
jgi:hypothetical protein